MPIITLAVSESFFEAVSAKAAPSVEKTWLEIVTWFSAAAWQIFRIANRTTDGPVRRSMSPPLHGVVCSRLSSCAPQLSGVLAVVAFGLTFASPWGRAHVDPHAEHFLHELWMTIGHVVNLIIFVLAGILIVLKIGNTDKATFGADLGCALVHVGWISDQLN